MHYISSVSFNLIYFLVSLVKLHRVWEGGVSNQKSVHSRPPFYTVHNLCDSRRHIGQHLLVYRLAEYLQILHITLIPSLEFKSKVRRAVTLLRGRCCCFLFPHTEVKNQGFLLTSYLRPASHKNCVLSLRFLVVGDTAYSFSDTCLTRETCIQIWGTSSGNNKQDLDIYSCHCLVIFPCGQCPPSI